MAKSEPRTVLEHSCIGEGSGGFPAKDQGPPTANWRQEGVVVGDVGFPHHGIFRHEPVERFQEQDDQYRAPGVVVVVAAGRTASLEVVNRKASFLRDPVASGGDGHYSLSDGAELLKLTACDEDDTRFLEALIVGGAQCVRLSVANRSGTQGVVDMPFATECH